MPKVSVKLTAAMAEVAGMSVVRTEVGDVNRYEAVGATIAIRAISSMRRGVVPRLLLHWLTFCRSFDGLAASLAAFRHHLLSLPGVRPFVLGRIGRL